tara:strand:+ start:113753 stop:114517 length:765 start_codon:yes stop_codon:yes gene_type:complete
MNFDVLGITAVMIGAVIGSSLQTETSGADSANPSDPFRVVTTIFSGRAQEPSAEHLVLFHDSLVYDFPRIHDGQITVYDLKRGRVILLDRATQVRSTVPTTKLMELTAQLRAQAITPQAKEQLGVDAEVDRNDDLSQYSIRYGSLEYETDTQTPSRASIATQYGQFADLASQLNIARALGMPPIGRMKMNRQIADDARLPQQTTLTISKFGSRKTFRSTHELIERISQEDRSQIDEVGNMLALYREVPLSEFPE